MVLTTNYVLKAFTWAASVIINNYSRGFEFFVNPKVGANFKIVNVSEVCVRAVNRPYGWVSDELDCCFSKILHL